MQSRWTLHLPPLLNFTFRRIVNDDGCRWLIPRVPATTSSWCVGAIFHKLICCGFIACRVRRPCWGCAGQWIWRHLVENPTLDLVSSTYSAVKGAVPVESSRNLFGFLEADWSWMKKKNIWAECLRWEVGQTGSASALPYAPRLPPHAWRILLADLFCAFNGKGCFRG